MRGDFDLLRGRFRRTTGPIAKLLRRSFLRRDGQGMARLVQHYFYTPGHLHHRDGSESFLPRLTFELNSLFPQSCDGPANIAAHEGDLIMGTGPVARGLFGVNAEF